VQIAIDVASAIISPFITWKLTNQLALVVLSTIFGPLLVHTIVNIIEFNAKYPKMRSFLYSALGVFKDVASFLDEAYNLDRGKRNISLSFAINSLKGLTEKGFIEVDVPYYAFLDYIKNLSNQTREKIFGTSAIRRPKEMAQDDFSKGYLKILLENKSRKLVRVTILTEEDIRKIIQEALDNLQPYSGSPPATPINIKDIPEIEWWVTYANEISYRGLMTPDIRWESNRILLWTIKEKDDNKLVESSLRPGTIDDYAVFDDAVVIKFRENRDVKRGILFLMWGIRIAPYRESWDKIREALTTGSALQLGDLGLFASFYDLLANLDLTINISSYEVICSHFSDTEVLLCKVYEKIIELINNSKARFASTYTDIFR